MNVDNFIVRPAREWVERYARPDAWSGLTRERAGQVAQRLAGLPSAYRDDDENAKRFDLQGQAGHRLHQLRGRAR